MVADEVEVAVAKVVEPLADVRAGRQGRQCLGGVETGRDPALVGGRLGDDVADRGHDVAVAEVQDPGGVGADRVGPDDVDVVVVGAGPGGELPDVGGAQQRRRTAENLGTLHGLDATELGVVAVEADDHPDATERGVAHRDGVARRHPAAATDALGVEGVGLAVDAEHLARRGDEHRGVVDDVGRRAALVGPRDEVDAELCGDVAQRLDDGAGQLGDELPQPLDGDAGGEPGRRRLGQDDELGARGLDAPSGERHELVEVGGDRLRGERPGRGGDLDGRGGERAHQDRPR